MSRVTECQELYDKILRYGWDPDNMKFVCNRKVYRELTDEIRALTRNPHPMPVKRFRCKPSMHVCGLPVVMDATVDPGFAIILMARLPGEEIS